MKSKVSLIPKRHAELGSASIMQLWLNLADIGTLKRVQGDGVSI
jgi:hypothetical protein